MTGEAEQQRLGGGFVVPIVTRLNRQLLEQVPAKRGAYDDLKRCRLGRLDLFRDLAAVLDEDARPAIKLVQRGQARRQGGTRGDRSAVSDP